MLVGGGVAVGVGLAVGLAVAVVVGMDVIVGGSVGVGDSVAVAEGTVVDVEVGIDVAVACGTGTGVGEGLGWITAGLEVGELCKADGVALTQPTTAISRTQNMPSAPAEVRAKTRVADILAFSLNTFKTKPIPVLPAKSAHS